MAGANFPIPVTSGAGANAIHLKHVMNGGIRWCRNGGYVWSQMIRFTDIQTGATANAKDLDATFANNKFPNNVIRRACYIKLLETFSGGSISAMTVKIGDVGVDNGLLTATNIFTGVGLGYISTPAATEYTDRPEAGFIPLATFTSTSANLSALTQGRLQIFIEFSPIPQEVES